MLADLINLIPYRYRDGIRRIPLVGVLQRWVFKTAFRGNIDTEGYELNVLAGASTALSSGKIGAVVCEATLDLSDKAHTNLFALSSELVSHGYYLATIYDQVVWTSPSRLAYFNALFVRGSAETPYRGV